jgi:hypothetical protein
LRSGRRERIYRIRYVGYGAEEDTWEPHRNLKNTPEAVKKWEERRGRGKSRRNNEKEAT